jgi:glycosyltransferase involved in cell wall biosynthesis
MAGRYLMVLRVPGHRCGPDAFEIESAFAEHLRMLRRKLGPLAETLVLAAPELSAAQRAPLTLARVEAREGIVFRGLCPAGLGRLAYLRRLPSVLAALRAEVERADVVHAGLSDPFRPLEFPALVMARRRGKKTISVTDIDNRNSARMRYRTGQWSLRQYLTSRMVYDGAEHLQQLYAVRRFSLVLLKGRALAADYGRGRPHVKDFLDSAFEADQLIPPARLEAKLADAADPARPLRAIYFGRLVPYKGVDHMLRAVRAALDLGARVELQIVGDGEARAALEALAAELRLGSRCPSLAPCPSARRSSSGSTTRTSCSRRRSPRTRRATRSMPAPRARPWSPTTPTTTASWPRRARRSSSCPGATTRRWDGACSSSTATERASPRSCARRAPSRCRTRRRPGSTGAWSGRRRCSNERRRLALTALDPYRPRSTRASCSSSSGRNIGIWHRALPGWTDLGLGLAGQQGVPSLAGSGLPAGGSPITLTLSKALSSSLAHLVMGLSLLDAPFKGGILVPHPDQLVLALPTGAAGSMALTGTLPVGMPAGVDLYFQMWVEDGTAVHGLSASNGLRGETQ